ncbi:hypothetical protein Patl1_08244 [Pistacia atlantica]|uniref:Uncharacterized protein n=1 Tax=Pistacia atlantica TaxID=434234 RepID=A0ACC1AGY4_9ROSI|nr:hypothetical protein Patl1_08244 [Pistacia atlantica]
MVSPSEEESGNQAEPWFKSKKGSVIPAKRRLLKRLMFDHFVKSIASLFGSTWCSDAISSLKMVSEPNSTNDGKSTAAVYPCPPESA